MIRWVVTGPTGAGKSKVTEILARMGAAVLDGDRLGHEVLKDPSVIEMIAKEFGEDLVVDGRVDRGNLGRLVFGNQEALQKLNLITHQKLSALADIKLNDLAGGADHVLAVLEAAVYFLLPSPPRADLVISVLSPVEIRVHRLIASGLPENTARDRVARQAGMELAFATADVIINNAGSVEDLEKTVNQLVAEHLPRLLDSDL